jgi:hypothetical protein
MELGIHSKHPHMKAMTNTVSGWNMRVTMLHPAGGPPIVHTYDIAIADVAEAVAAARDASGADLGAIVETVGPLSPTTSLRVGEVRPR